MQIRTREKFIKYINRAATMPSGRRSFTPYILVDGIINKLDSINWSNPNLRILDPCFGFGSFLFACYVKLKEFHTEEHILNNMLFGIEIEPFRYELVKMNFAIKHLYKEDFLNPSDELKKVLDMKFDCVIGNPPYQNSNDTNQGSSGKLWMKFVDKAIYLLKTNGYMVFLHPTTWRQMNNKMWSEIYQTYQIESVVLEPKVNWNVGVNVDYYVLKNTKYLTPTNVIYNDGTVSEIDFRQADGLLSSANNTNILSKLRHSITLEFNHKHSHDTRRAFMSPTKKRGFIYPIQHTGAQDCWWSNKKHEWQDLKKVIVSRSGYIKPIFDNASMGTSQESYSLFVSGEKEANYIIRLLNSKLYTFIIQIQKTNGFNDIKMLNKLPYPKDLLEKFTDGDLYEYFGLTDAEINVVEETVKWPKLNVLSNE